jgi:K+-sensing histidine kinase KdpD
MANHEISFSDLIASSVHDMKNSLNVQVDELEKIAGHCSARGDIPGHQALVRVIYQASRMNANLIQLLSLYKLGNASYPVDIAEHRLADVIDDALAHNRSIVQANRIAVAVECADDCFWYLDRDLVTGVLVNALNNAYQYTRDKIRIVAQASDGALHLRVEDNGPGYPASMLGAGGLDDARGVNFLSNSTGLGFYFSGKVAGVHRNGERSGTLTVENGGAYGGGCFVLTLP